MSKTAHSSAIDLLVLKETSLVVVVVVVGALGLDGGESASIAAVAISMLQLGTGRGFLVGEAAKGRSMVFVRNDALRLMLTFLGLNAQEMLYFQ